MTHTRSFTHTHSQTHMDTRILTHTDTHSLPYTYTLTPSILPTPGLPKANSLVRAKSLQSCLILCDPMNCSPLAPLSMGFSRQEHWSGLPCPPAGDLPDPGIKPTSLMSPELAGRFFTTSVIWGPPVPWGGFSSLLPNTRHWAQGSSGRTRVLFSGAWSRGR